MKPSGMSLIAVLVTLVIVAIATTGASRILMYNLKALKFVQLHQELEDIRSYIRLNISCEDTFVFRPPECDTGEGFIEAKHLPRSNGTPSGTLINIPNSGNYTVVGSTYILRARCRPCANCAGNAEFIVEVNKTDATVSRPVEGPKRGLALSGEPLGPSSTLDQGWANLFPQIPVGCVIPDA